LKATLVRAVDAKLFPKRVLALVDSTGVMGAAAVADTYELVRQAIAKVVSGGGVDAFPKKLRRRVRGVVAGKAKIDWGDAGVRRSELGRLVSVARSVLDATADNDGLVEARELLERIIDQDIDVAADDGQGPAIRRGVAKDRVVSVVDPEMRHGRKSRTKRVDGYKAHIVTDHDNELILSVATTAANVPDGLQAAGLVRAAKTAGVPVAEVLAIPPTAMVIPALLSNRSASRSPPRPNRRHRPAGSPRPISLSIRTGRQRRAPPGTPPPILVGAPTTRGGGSSSSSSETAASVVVSANSARRRRPVEVSR
jgi:hypothetical protein